MLLQIILACISGIFAGIITGLTPGLHINLVAVVVLGMAGSALSSFEPITLAAFITAMSVTHTFVDFIPSILLGAPDENTALAVLPGHVLLKRGLAYEGIRISSAGTLTGMLATLACVPFLLFLVPFIFSRLQTVIGFLLLGILAFMIARESTWQRRMWSLLIMTLAGILGLIVFSMHDIKQPLLPMLSGLFGTAILLNSLSQQAKIPTQRVTEMIKISNLSMIKAASAGTLSGSLVSIFPGLGPAQAAIISSQFFRHIGIYSYLFMMGAIGASSMVMGFVTLMTIEKARNGTVAAIAELLATPTWHGIGLLFAVMLLVSGMAVRITLYLSRMLANTLGRMNYTLVSLGVILFIAAMVIYFESWKGLLILATATAIGLVPNLTGVGRNNGMAAIIVPVILYLIL